MKDCGRFEEIIQSVISGDAGLDRLEIVVEHCRACGDCRELFEMHRNLSEAGGRFAEFEPADLSAARASIIAEISAARRRKPARLWMNALRSPFVFRPVTAVAIVAAAFALGLLSSRFRANPQPPVHEISMEALANPALANDPGSPYSYSNVSVKFLAEDQVALAFDVTKHVEVVQPTQSELVKGILMYSVLHPSPTGGIGHFQTKSPQGKFFY